MRPAMDDTWRSHLEVHTRQRTETSRCFLMQSAFGYYHTKRERRRRCLTPGGPPGKDVRLVIHSNDSLNSFDPSGRRACRRAARGCPNIVVQAGTKGGGRPHLRI